MIELIISLLVEVLMGAALVCSEAHTLPQDARIAVAASVKNRVKETGWPAVKVMRYPRAYAPYLCKKEQLEWLHFRAYIRGRLGYGPDWTKNVYAFYHVRLNEKLRDTWKRRGLVKIKGHGGKHVYWKKKAKL